MTLQPAAVRSPPFRREHRQAPEPCSGTLSGQARAQPGEGWPAGQLPPGPHQPRNAAERAPRGCVCAHAPAVARHETPWACRVPPYQRGGRVPVGPPCGRPVQGPAPSLCPTCPRGVIDLPRATPWTQEKNSYFKERVRKKAYKSRIKKEKQKKPFVFTWGGGTRRRGQSDSFIYLPSALQPVCPLIPNATSPLTLQPQPREHTGAPQLCTFG